MGRGDRGRKECERPRESVGSRDQPFSVSLSLWRGLGCTCLEKEAKVLSTLCTAEGNDERKTTVCVCGVCGVRCEVWEASVSE